MEQSGYIPGAVRVGMEIFPSFSRPGLSKIDELDDDGKRHYDTRRVPTAHAYNILPRQQ